MPCVPVLHRTVVLEGSGRWETPSPRRGCWYALFGKREVGFGTNQRFVAVPTPISFKTRLVIQKQKAPCAMATTRSLIFLCLGP